MVMIYRPPFVPFSDNEPFLLSIHPLTGWLTLWIEIVDDVQFRSEPAAVFTEDNLRGSTLSAAQGTIPVP